MITVDPIVLIYAFRYALGRRSYAVSDVAALLERHRDALVPHHRELICREIADAIRCDDAGAASDELRWRQVAEALAVGYPDLAEGGAPWPSSSSTT